MQNRSLSRRVLVANTASFAIGFAAWVALGPSARTIVAGIGLPPESATLLKVSPILIGSALRVPLGVATDRFGARVMFPLLLATCAFALFGLTLCTSYGALLAMAALMGVVGATFVVGVQAVARFTERERQGVALGIFGAGNVGTALTTFLFPLLASALGTLGALRAYAALLVVTALLYAVVCPNTQSDSKVPLRVRLVPLKSRLAWRLGLYYVATFGAFVAATLTLSDIYRDTYQVSARDAGLLATSFTLAASLSRIGGGKLADRIGSRRTLQGSLLFTGTSLAGVVVHPPLAITLALVFVAALAMGVGMAAVMRYIADCFPNSVGTVGGVVGALGGIGGFLLPIAGQWTGAHFHDPLLSIVPLAALALLAFGVQLAWVRLQRDPGRRAAHFSASPAE